MPPKSPTDRIAFSAIVDRPPLPLPEGARMVLWSIVNLEEWDIAGVMPRHVTQPPSLAKAPIPDIPNWTWHEYGMRVGFWRIKQIMDEFHIVPTVAINGNVCNAYPRVAQACKDGGWEFMGHGFMQKTLQAVADEREDVRKTVEAIRNFTGKPPRGWLGPGLVETAHTVDVLSELGFDYVADWVLDDQPCDLAGSPKPIVALPYTQECNDVPLILEQKHPAREFRDRAIDQFEQLYADAQSATRIMSIAMHPYLMGVPHRSRYVREIYQHVTRRKGVLFWTGEQILDWYRRVRPHA
jgi:peptidoglycan/xylan/chitin deacetylase (PgdA/CDA1 family)